MRESNHGMRVGTQGLGYPLLLCLGKGLVVILNYALTAEQPDPCGLEPYSPGKWPRTTGIRLLSRQGVVKDNYETLA